MVFVVVAMHAVKKAQSGMNGCSSPRKSPKQQQRQQQQQKQQQGKVHQARGSHHHHHHHPDPKHTASAVAARYLQASSAPGPDMPWQRTLCRESLGHTASCVTPASSAASAGHWETHASTAISPTRSWQERERECVCVCVCCACACACVRVCVCVKLRKKHNPGDKSQHTQTQNAPASCCDGASESSRWDRLACKYTPAAQ